MCLYTGSTVDNWESSSCFFERPFICQLPEGSTLPSVPVITGAMSAIYTALKCALSNKEMRLPSLRLALDFILSLL